MAVSLWGAVTLPPSPPTPADVEVAPLASGVTVRSVVTEVVAEVAVMVVVGSMVVAVAVSVPVGLAAVAMLVVVAGSRSSSSAVKP